MSYQLFKTVEEIDIKDKEASIKDIYELWQECFLDAPAYMEFYFSNKMGSNQVLTIYKEEQLASMLHLNPYILNVRGTLLPSYYIVGVATKESHRRKGLMKQLIEAALYTMYEENIPFTYLCPAAKEIYLPFDFQVVYELPLWDEELYNFSKSNSERGKSNITIYPFASLKDVKDLVNFSNQYLSSQFDITVHRDAMYYERLNKEVESEDGEIIMAEEKGILTGYASYMAGAQVHITELLAKDTDTKESLYSYIEERHKNKLKKMDFKPTIMTRIVNIETFLSLLKSTEEISFTIQLDDSFIPANRGSYRVTINSEKGMSKREEVENPDITCDIKDLTKLFFGQMKEAELDSMFTINKKERVREQIKKIHSLHSLFINDTV